MPHLTGLNLSLPRWLPDMLPPASHRFATAEERMEVVIRLSRENVRRRTGGPFAAAVFDLKTLRLTAAGVNLVEHSGLSMAHAEIIAIALAQQVVGHYDLSANGMTYELVASAEPCAMCQGAVIWSGVASMVCGARDADIRGIGFDEGHKAQDWPAAFARRGIRLVCDVGRRQAVEVLKTYANSGGAIYNPDSIAHRPDGRAGKNDEK